LLLAITIAHWQSQCIDTDGTGFIPNEMYAKKFFNHLASLSAISRATNFDFNPFKYNHSLNYGYI